MTTNLLQTVQKNLGFAELKKVDPNTQEIKANTTFDEDKLNQAATSAVMAALYKYSRCNEGSEQILCADIMKNWLETIFGDSTKEAITKVANYAHVSNEKAMQKMEMIARESVKVIRDKNLLVVNDVKNILTAEKPAILIYLPAALQMGNLLNDETMDDHTQNGRPVSGFMNSFGELFDQSEKPKQDKS